MDIELKSKNILITGGAGFIGSHLVDRLIGTGNKAVVVDNLSSGRKESINKKARFYKMDTRSPKLSDVLKREKIEIVFHLAAQPIVDTAYLDPRGTLENNIISTVNVLEAARKVGRVPGTIITSSDKAYGKAVKLPYKESHPLSGDHPYDTSKSSSDLIAQAYFKTYNLPIIITRFSNVFGSGDLNFNRVIPGIFEAIIKNKEFLIRSDGKMIREYTYVEDIVDGYIKLAENSENISGEAFNFGSKNIFNVLDVVKKIEEILNVKINHKILNIAKNEIPEQYLDWSKAKNVLGWQPKYSFEDGIIKTFNWYKNEKY